MPKAKIRSHSRIEAETTAAGKDFETNKRAFTSSATTVAAAAAAAAGSGRITSAEDVLSRKSQEQDNLLYQHLVPAGRNGDEFASITAIVNEGAIRTGHGLQIDLQAKVRSSNLKNSHFEGLSLDIHGDAVFRALPSGLGLVAKGFLPLPLRASIRYQKTTHDRNVVLTFTVGAARLSRGRIDSVLNDIVNGGDEVFVFELQGADGKCWGFLPTKASLIQRSLSTPGGASIRCYEKLPVYHRGSDAMKWIKFLKYPTFFGIGSWLVWLHPTLVNKYIPMLLHEQYYANFTSILSNSLPLCPDNMKVAFQLGILKQRLVDVMATSATADTVQSILHQAADLTGKSVELISVDSLLNVLTEIEKFESKVSVVTKVRGFLSFVNFLWLCAILGIGVSVGPSIYHILVPLRDIIMRISRWVFNEVILPLTTRLHSWGVFETVAYMCCFLAVVEGFRMDQETGLYVALTGAVVYIPCVVYSCFLWGRRLLKLFKDKTLMQISCVWVAIVLTPLTIHFGSTFCGYLVVMLLFSALGFSFFIGHMCIAIGFDSSDSVPKVHFSSAALLLAYLSVCIAASLGAGSAAAVSSSSSSSELVAFLAKFSDSAALAPFSSPIAVIGSNMFGLTLLILCTESHMDQYVRRGAARLQVERLSFGLNLYMVVSLLLLQLLGHILGRKSLVSVSIVYFFLWASQKYVNFHMRNKFNTWILILMCSITLWQVSLYLKSNPVFIASLFSI